MSLACRVREYVTEYVPDSIDLWGATYTVDGFDADLGTVIRAVIDEASAFSAGYDDDADDVDVAYLGDLVLNIIADGSSERFSNVRIVAAVPRYGWAIYDADGNVDGEGTSTPAVFRTRGEAIDFLAVGVNQDGEDYDLSYHVDSYHGIIPE